MRKIDEKYAEYTVGEKKIDELHHKIAMKMGVSDSAMWILYHLCELNTVHTQNSIAEKVGVPKQTINSAMNRLMKDGLVYMEKLSVAGNNKQILLTDAGKNFCKKYILPFVEAEERAFERLTEEEQELYLSLGIKHNRFMMEEFNNLLNNK